MKPKKTQKGQFFKRIQGRICRLIQTRIEQNDDHTHKMRNIQFRGSFKSLQCGKKFLILLLLLLLKSSIVNLCQKDSLRVPNVFFGKVKPFSAWWPLKGNTYLNLKLKAAGLFKYM